MTSHGKGDQPQRKVKTSLVWNLVKLYRPVRVEVIANEFAISHGSALLIITVSLTLSKLSAW